MAERALQQAAQASDQRGARRLLRWSAIKWCSAVHEKPLDLSRVNETNACVSCCQLTNLDSALVNQGRSKVRGTNPL